ncbi:MAG TPA: hypothetical protein VLI46_10700 [Ramlibacter sp.]|nr:hypothetical protein [Ramlibacter sp.]
MHRVKHLTAAAGLLVSSAGALAHGGHGLGEAHWHATDTAGFVLVAILAAVAIWLSRGD